MSYTNFTCLYAQDLRRASDTGLSRHEIYFIPGHAMMFLGFFCFALFYMKRKKHYIFRNIIKFEHVLKIQIHNTGETNSQTC